MIEEYVDKIKSNFTELSKLSPEFQNKLENIEGEDGSKINFSHNVPGASGDLNLIFKRFTAAIDQISAISSCDNSLFFLIPKTVLNEFGNRLEKICQELKEIADIFNQIEADGGVGSIESSAFEIQSVNGNQNPQLAGRFKNIDNQIDGLYDSIYKIGPVVSTDNFRQFGANINRANELYENLQGIKSTLSDLRRVAKQHGTNIENFYEQSEQNKNNIEEWKNKTENDVAKIEENKNKIENILENIDETIQKSNELDSLVNNNTEKLTEFDKKLGERNRDFEKLNKASASIQSELKEKSEESDRLIEKSKEALGWSTASGLAEGFEKSSNDLDGPLLRAQVLFFVSIAFLILSVGIAFNGVPYLENIARMPSIVPPADMTGAGAVIYVMSTISIKVAVLLPAFLLTAFSARKHKSLFHAKEQYRFKKTVASSLPGFKEEAPEHKSAMAAAAFERLLTAPDAKNRADNDSGRSKGGPLTRWISGIVRRAMDESDNI